MRRVYLLLPVFLFALVSHSCKQTTTRNRIDENHFPRVILWAWERPEDLEFLDPQRFGVAFLAQTLTLKDGEVVYSPRHQPLKLHPGAKLIAVTRIESQKITREHVDLTDDLRKQLVEHIRKTLQLNNVSAVQVDFDAATSERTFYRQLLQDLRRELPDNVALSMTALASFCVGDRWLKDLPVDEAVPMVFRMGIDSDRIRNLLTGGDFSEALCRRSYGVALDEPVRTSFDKQRRVYVFNARSWTPADISLLEERFGH
ncbi:MAG TPA: DUF3142 domain-containing protein [Pyrinomonadaceae bacterium]|jgi:Protein of unknown function (DUF3142).|nr:DUF3142 domain-containing protein [Pyrinomonadaceae bacterium]